VALPVLRLAPERLGSILSSNRSARYHTAGNADLLEPAASTDCDIQNWGDTPVERPECDVDTAACNASTPNHIGWLATYSRTAPTMNRTPAIRILEVLHTPERTNHAQTARDSQKRSRPGSKSILTRVQSHEGCASGILSKVYAHRFSMKRLPKIMKTCVRFTLIEAHQESNYLNC
jgi:hypothetical protein